MRKHFLILMLMALLPLAGWSAEVTEPTNISSGWQVKLYVGGLEKDRATYTGESVAPVVRLENGGGDFISSSNFNVVWKDGSGNTITPAQIVDVIPGGNYTVTVSGNDDVTYGNIPADKATASFWVTKATATIATAPALSAAQAFTGSPLNLLSTEATLTSDFNEHAVIEYSTDGETWAAGMPKATKAAVYSVSYRVVGNSNFNGIPATPIAGTTSITGYNFDPTDHIDVPTPKTTLAFTWDATEGKAVAQGLINPGSLKGDAVGKGTFMYKVGAGEWSTDIPTGTNAGDYVVSWKIVGDPAYGFYDYTAGADVDVNIAKATPAINATATAASNLKYPGDAGAQLALLATEGTATMGATVKYMIKAPGAADFAAAVAWADVKGKAAGDYKIKPVVEVSTNYNAVIPADDAALVVTANIAKAQALTAAPTAIAGLTWNNAPQKLFNAGEGTISGKVKYILTPAATPAPATDAPGWVTAIDDASLKGDDADTYYAWYQVTDANYETVEPTPILGANDAPVKIAPATVSIIVNNASKVYDATGAINALTVATKFTVTNAVATAPVDVTGLKYTNEDAGLGDDYKNATTYEGALTAAAADVATINAGYGTNYEYTVVPGNLTINPRPIYVEAKGSVATFGEVYDISKDYIIKGGEAGDVDASTATAEQIANFFATAPVLTTDADPTLPAVAVYDIEFTAGTTAANYTMNLTKGENNDGYFINGKKFEVVEDPTHKLVITVLPHKKTYDGVAESWADVNEGVDYVVSGLITGDVITKKPTFSRSDATNYNFGTYVLSAADVEVSNQAAHYPGGIVYNNSTFDIEAKELVADVAQQTIYKTAGVTVGDIAIANAALDANAWTVDGLENNETLADLGATLAVDNVGTTAGRTNISAPGFYDNGILLTITNTNYTLKAGTEYATLRVIAAETVELDPTNTKLAELIEAKKYVAATDNKYDVTFAHKTLKADRWYTMVLPFDVKTTELVNQLKDENGDEVYAIVNRLSESSTADHLKYALEMKEIPANEPFLIKAASDVDLQDVTFVTKKIIYTATPSVGGDDFAGNQFVGVYTATSIKNGTPANTVYGFLGDPDKATGMKNEWYQPKNNAWTVNPMEAYLIYSPNKTVSAPLITVEDFGGQTTAISTVNSDIKVISTDGWYTINGVKLQGAPTEKGIYINNGKKIVVK